MLHGTKIFCIFTQISLVWFYLHSMSYKIFLSGIFYLRTELFCCKIAFYALLHIISIVHWIIFWSLIVLRFELIRAKLYCFSDKETNTTYPSIILINCFNEIRSWIAKKNYVYITEMNYVSILNMFTSSGNKFITLR